MTGWWFQRLPIVPPQKSRTQLVLRLVVSSCLLHFYKTAYGPLASQRLFFEMGALPGGNALVDAENCLCRKQPCDSWMTQETGVHPKKRET